jgi:hypothetical protein
MARRFHRAGRAMASGWKGSLGGLATGAVVSFGTSFATSRVDFLKASQNWWATPVALAMLGHFMARGKMAPIGHAILGVAGAVAVENFTHSPTNAAGYNAPLGGAGAIPGDYSGAGAYNENQMTDASPGTNAALNSPQAAALLGGGYGAGMLYDQGGTPVGATGWGDADDMMGLQD